jgi:hypothetical protein
LPPRFGFSEIFWGTIMSSVAQADILVTIHLVFVAFVVVGQLLILVGWLRGWRWVRNFTFRVIHFLSIAVVAAEGVAGIVCPLTEWERQLRGGDLFDVSEACAVGRVANRILFYQGDHAWFQRAHITFGVLVLLTFIMAPPRWPGRRRPEQRRDAEPVPVASEAGSVRALSPADKGAAGPPREEAHYPGATAL